tara:strand:- start:667 stop:909 length:243 start_codon:yes stop_codon:yes gene_type:complete
MINEDYLEYKERVGKIEEIKDEYRSLLISLSNIEEKIMELASEKSMMDDARLWMEEKFNFDPKDFITERINGKAYYEKEN